jgi:hypothetical protein
MRKFLLSAVDQQANIECSMQKRPDAFAVRGANLAI